MSIRPKRWSSPAKTFDRHDNVAVGGPEPSTGPRATIAPQSAARTRGRVRSSAARSPAHCACFRLCSRPSVTSNPRGGTSGIRSASGLASRQGPLGTILGTIRPHGATKGRLSTSLGQVSHHSRAPASGVAPNASSSQGTEKPRTSAASAEVDRRGSHNGPRGAGGRGRTGSSTPPN